MVSLRSIAARTFFMFFRKSKVVAFIAASKMTLQVYTWRGEQSRCRSYIREKSSIAFNIVTNIPIEINAALAQGPFA